MIMWSNLLAEGEDCFEKYFPENENSILIKFYQNYKKNFKTL